jgi:hypothetical protein
MFAAKRPEPDRLKELCETVGKVLTGDQRRVFGNLGELGKPGFKASVSALTVRAIERFAELTGEWFTVRAGGASTTGNSICNCAIETACSSCPGYCRNGPPFHYDMCAVAYSPENCGCFWQYQCDGNCQETRNDGEGGGQ